jgi:hypothetical protein
VITYEFDPSNGSLRSVRAKCFLRLYPRARRFPAKHNAVSSRSFGDVDVTDLRANNLCANTSEHVVYQQARV